MRGAMPTLPPSFPATSLARPAMTASLTMKRSFVERFLREYLYDQAERPRVVGKRDERDAPLIPADGELNADRLRPLLAGES